MRRPARSRPTRAVETDPRANPVSYDLDSSGRTVNVVDGNGVARAKTWIPNSDVATAVDAVGTGQTAAGVTTTYTYDTGTGNLTGVKLPTGATANAYYAAGSACSTSDAGHPYQAKCTTDAQGNTASFTYDGPGNVLTATDSTSGGTAVKTYTYQGTNGVTCGGKPGAVCSATDGIASHVTRYAYDTDGNLVTVTPPTVTTGTQLGTVTYTYDSVGRVTTVKDGKNQTTSYAYDARDRSTQTTHAGTGGKVITAYDADGNQTAQYDVSSTSVVSTSAYSFDTLNRQLTKTLPGQALADIVEYDESGNVTDYTDPTGFRVRYGYDNANQLTSIGNGVGCDFDPTGCTTLAYAAGRLQTMTYPGNTVQSYKYDNAGRPTEVAAAHGTTQLTKYNYTYGASGCTGTGPSDTALIKTRTDVVGNGATANSKITYCYDSLGRLTQGVEKVGSSTTTNASWTYGYDAAGNRTSSSTLSAGVTQSLTYGYNQADELVTRNGDATGWSHDANGNELAAGGLVSAAVAKRTDTVSSRDQVASITTIGTGGSTTAYGYLGEGNNERTQAGSTGFLNGALGLATGGDYGYTRTPGGAPIAQRQTDGTSLYYLTDAQGSVVAMVNTSGTKVASYSYSPYGEARSASGTASATNPLRYTGGYLDSNTGLYKLGYRYYDPSIGRFTQPDPSGQETNPYSYASGNPVNRVDLKGLASSDSATGDAGTLSATVLRNGRILISFSGVGSGVIAGEIVIVGFGVSIPFAMTVTDGTGGVSAQLHGFGPAEITVTAAGAANGSLVYSARPLFLEHNFGIRGLF